MAAARDPKKKWVEGHHRLLTIHDGTRLTPTLVAALQVLAEAAEEIANATTPEASPGSYQRRQLIAELTPRMVARADGLALYVDDRRIG